MNVTLGSFFTTGKKNIRENDIFFDDEEVFTNTAGQFDCVIADPLYFRAIPQFKGTLVKWSHHAVSGDLF